MIKVENIETFNFEGAIRGMRNPHNSWNKSDSYYCDLKHCGSCKQNPETRNCFQPDGFVVGASDLDLMRRLYKAGNEHRKYLRQIFVSMDIIAPLYWIAELDTYKIGTTRNSCSFMHKGTSKPFEITDFSIHDERVYTILSPLTMKEYALTYPYETKEYKKYICENGREYRVYKNGRIYAEPFEYTDTKGRNRKFDLTECKPSTTKSGYYEIHIGGRNGERWLLHRLVASVWLDDENDLYTVNHIDGNKGNNSVENLEWCSLADNIKKGFDNGLYENGKSLHTKYIKWKNGHTIVNPFIKQQIVLDHRNGLTCSKLSEKYNITTSQANNIICGNNNEFKELFMLCYMWEQIIDSLNRLRDIYLETKDNNIFQQIRCLLPSGYNQRFTITMNYENVFNIIKQRSTHKLDEWKQFCDILKELPYIKEIGEF